MKKLLLLAIMVLCVSGVYSQAELQRLLTTYTESVRLPLYRECKQWDSKIPESVKSVALDGDALTIVYVVCDVYGDKFTYTVRIELSKSSLSVDNLNVICITCVDGIEVFEENGKTGKKYPFLVEKWSIKCNDTPLCNRLVAALKQFGKLKESGERSGKTVGKAFVGGNSWSLPGRSLKGRLAQPSYTGNEVGVIVVAVRVDASGMVVDANIEVPV